MQNNNLQGELHPEYYRKSFENIKGSNVETPEPFSIGLIDEIINGSVIRVRKFYRPENTHRGKSVMTYQSDLNLIYWSEELVQIPFTKVIGKCYIAYGDGLGVPVNDWSRDGPHRFYFNQAYNLKTLTYEDVDNYAKKIGQPGKGKGITMEELFRWPLLFILRYKKNYSFKQETFF